MRNLKLYYFILALLIIFTGISFVGCSKAQPTASAEKGDPYWWKKQPDLKQEETAINQTITDIRAAFTAKDSEKALTYIAPDDREKFMTVFAKSPDILPQFAKDMKNATLSFLSLDVQDTLNRIAEYTMKVDGNIFYIEFIKVDGKWLIKNF